MPNMQGYNVLIHLNPLTIAKKFQSTNTNNYSVEIEDFDDAFNSKIPIVDFEPVQYYLKDLRV